jgi:hypothetical protein
MQVVTDYARYQDFYKPTVTQSRPIARRVSRGALLTTLQQTNSAVQSGAELTLRKAGAGETPTVAERESTMSRDLRPAHRPH